MKKKRIFLTTLIGIFSVSLIGCGNKLPTTNYEKVKFAFNGVEKSFKSPKVTKKNKNLLAKRNKIGGSNPSHGLDAIYNLYKPEDIRDDFLEDVSYNQPPMVQFQYIKKVLEKVGSGYEFNKKYYDTMTGDMYFDINTGLKKEGDEYKYNYTFVLGIVINIDDNDLINADVSFDIKLSKGNDTYNTKWYVGIELDYDMSNNSPNYQMTMVTENDERELPYYNHYTYEYDYVEVKNSSINEWRKFCMDNDHRLVKDTNHHDFNSYVEEGCEYNIDACSWYKDGVYRKNKRTKLDNNDAKVVGEALFTDLGLNANEIDADTFFAKDGVQNSVIKTCYQEFGKIAKEDIIYDLVCREEEGHGEEKAATSIRAMNADLSGGAGGYQVPGNTFISELLNGFVDNSGDKVAVHLYYLDQHGGLLEEITNLGALRYFIKAQNNEYSFEVHLQDKLEDVIRYGGFQDRNLSIAFLDGNNIGGSMDFYYAGDFQSSETKPEFPQVLKNLGVPEYEGERYTFANTSVLDKSPYRLVIANTDGNEEANYRTKLIKNGFEYHEVFGYGDYKKQVNSKNIIISINNAQIDNGYLTITINVEEVQSSQTNTINAVSLVGSFNDWDVNTNCVEFSKTGNNEFLLKEVHFAPNEKFKIVVNHSWGERGGYGFNDVMGLAGFPDIFEDEGEEHNILITRACVVSLLAAISGDNIAFQLLDAAPED